MSNRNIAVSVALTLLLSGCGVWQAASNTTATAYDTVFHNLGKTVDVDLSADANVNPDSAGHPRSVAVRVYQLKDRKRFDETSHADLVSNDTTVLEPDLQSSMAVVVNPGGAASVSQPMKKDTKFIAIAAIFQTADKPATWKQIVPVKKLPANAPLKLTLTNTTLDVDRDLTPRKP